MQILGWTATRIIVSGIANRIAKAVIRLPVRDFTSGFRCYSIKYILRAAPKLKSQRFEIQVETLRQAQLMGMKVTEIPIIFENRKRGRSKLTINEITNFLLYIIKACSLK